ncbi:MAG: RNA polymerase sigma factor RpoS [Gammaproteobacteria bacterium]
MIQTRSIAKTDSAGYVRANPWALNDRSGGSPSSSPSRGTSRALDPTQIYLSEIGLSPLLTADEEKAFTRAAQSGDERARHRMIKSNLRLVVKIARRYINRGLPLLDLIEEGNLGLMHAVEKFDPERGFRFSTYSTWWIRQTIERGLMNQTRTVRLPIHVVKEINACLRARRELTQTLNRVPTAEDIAAALERPRADVERLLELNDRAISSVAPSASPEGARELVDTLPDEKMATPAQAAQVSSVHTGVSRWLQQLSGKERAVLERRFGLHGHDTHTLEQVGAQIGVTRERVRQIQLKALANLRGLVEAEGLSLDCVLA